MANEILVVDDNLDIRVLITGILKDKGFVVREAANDGTSPVKPPSEVDRLKVRQTTDLLTLKQRQASELMAAKIRDVETKAREAQRKATAPKSAAVSAS